MITRCSAASRVPFGGYTALDTASAPRQVGFYRRLSRDAKLLLERFDSCPARPLQLIDSKRSEFDPE
jgi:hypothetical protein